MLVKEGAAIIITGILKTDSFAVFSESTRVPLSLV